MSHHTSPRAQRSLNHPLGNLIFISSYSANSLSFSSDHVNFHSNPIPRTLTRGKTLHGSYSISSTNSSGSLNRVSKVSVLLFIAFFTCLLRFSTSFYARSRIALPSSSRPIALRAVSAIIVFRATAPPISFTKVSPTK